MENLLHNLIYPLEKALRSGTYTHSTSEVKCPEALNHDLTTVFSVVGRTARNCGQHFCSHTNPAGHRLTTPLKNTGFVTI